ncbi:MAG: RHS repeat protein [Xanthomonadaceae bacterium]|nr:RHS repeat protein [Xanthomonadaceae bacterium]
MRNLKRLQKTSIFGWALAALAVWTPGRDATAQAGDFDYCYAGTCHSTLAAAEAAMNAAHPNYAGYFVPTKGARVGTGYSVLRPLYITYTVPDQPALALEAAAYNASAAPNPAPSMCSPSANPRYPTMCANESDLVAGVAASYQNAHGGTVTSELRGGYGNPYFSSSGLGSPPAGQQPYGQLTHNLQNTASGDPRRWLKIRVFNSEGVNTWTFDIQLFKISSYVCRAGFVGITGRHPNYLDGTQTTVLDPPNLCRATIAEQTITTRLRQSSCPSTQAGNPPFGINPCYPATGDKARFETDFEFAGRPFSRTYHSLRQLGQEPQFAPGWVHAYSDRISGNPSGLYDPMMWTNDSGYLEVFKRVGNSNRFVAEGNAKHLLDVEPTNTLPHKYIITSGDGNTLRYFNQAGRLIRIEGRDNAWKIEFAYGNGRLIAATDQFGSVLTFEYQNNRLSTIRLPDGNTVSYGYDATSNLQSVVYQDGSNKTYHYNETGLSDANDPHALTGITDNGVRYATYGYDNKGRVRLSHFHAPSGQVEKTELSYTGNNQVQVTDRHGGVHNLMLSNDSGYRRVLSTTSSNGTTSNTYNGALALQTTDRLGHVTRYEYDTNRAYVSARYDGYGTNVERKTVTTRDALYRATSILTQEKSGSNYVTKQQQSFTYNSSGQVLTRTTIDPATSQSRTVTTNYCTQADVDAAVCPRVGLVKSVDGARTDVADITTYTYRNADHPDCAASPTTCQYRKGQLWKVTNAAGQVSEILSHDGAGRVLSAKDANGVVTDLEYDARGRMLASKVRGANDASETDDRITRVEYWPTGLVKKVAQPDGSFTSYGYDSAHRLTSIADAEGNSITYTLDGADNRIGEQVKDDQGALMRSLTRTYNTLGQLQSQTDAYGRVTSFTYDADGNLDQSTDALTRVADNNTDPLGRLSRTLQDMNGIAAETKFTYDALDNLTQVNDPKGLNTTYTYNGLGDQTQLQSPDTGTTTYAYDSAGNRASQTDARSVATTYGYDALNRLTSVSVPTSSLNIGYVYDSTQTACQSGEGYSVGRLTRINDGSGSTVYCYNRFGDLVRKVQTTNGQSFTLRYQYNAAGQLTGMVYPDGASVDYAYDALGRVSEIGATPTGGTRQVVLTNATYYPFGPVAEWSYGNGRLMKRSLNQNYQPGFVEVVGAGGLSLGYEFDQVGNLKRLRGADQADPPRRVFGYDGLNHLTENRDGVSNALLEGYAYDKTGNRISATVGATTTPYSYPAGSHRLDSVGATARSYDNVGNTTQIGGTAKEFVYNDLNRMSQYRESGVAKMNYVYNGRGEQVRKHLGSSDTYSVYDEAGRWVGDYNGSGAPVQQVVWFSDLPVAVLEGASTAQKLYYVEADMLGTPRVVVDPVRGATGTAVWTWDLAGEAFGNTAPNQDPDGDSTAFVFNMRFPGQRYDAASGLNYNYFRDYEAATGRYVESDPQGVFGGTATFSYAHGLPMNLIDPFGLRPCPPGMVQNSMLSTPVPCWIDDGDGRGSGYPNEGRCATAECAAGILPNPIYSPNTLCQIDCNVRFQWVCTGGTVIGGSLGTPATGYVVGGGCVLAKYFICRWSCKDKDGDRCEMIRDE